MEPYNDVAKERTLQKRPLVPGGNAAPERRPGECLLNGRNSRHQKKQFAANDLSWQETKWKEQEPDRRQSFPYFRRVFRGGKDTHSGEHRRRKSQPKQTGEKVPGHSPQTSGNKKICPQCRRHCHLQVQCPNQVTTGRKNTILARRETNGLGKGI